MMALSKLLHMALVDSGVVVGTKRMLVPEAKLLTGSMNPVESVGATRMRCSMYSFRHASGVLRTNSRATIPPKLCPKLTAFLCFLSLAVSTSSMNSLK